MENDEKMIRLEKIARSDDPEIRRRFPHILLLGNEGCGEKQFCDEYTRIVSEYEIVGSTHKTKLLMLKFPEEGSEQDYEKFFRSPLSVAKRNSVMVILFKTRIK